MKIYLAQFLSIFLGQRAICLVYGHHIIEVPDSQIKNLWIVGCDTCGKQIAVKFLKGYQQPPIY